MLFGLKPHDLVSLYLSLFLASFTITSFLFKTYSSNTMAPLMKLAGGLSVSIRARSNSDNR